MLLVGLVAQAAAQQSSQRPAPFYGEIKQDRPDGPRGPAAAQVFTFADRFTPMLCHLARTVEAAGGWLHVLGLRDGQKSRLPGGDVSTETDSATRDDEPWHFEDKSIMLKKHLFLLRAIKRLPANTTVVFVDAFDVLFQRPLEELLQSYERIAGPAARASAGAWPVVYGGELNCWPFPHRGRIRVRSRDRQDASGRGAHWIHKIPPDASQSANHHGRWRYPGHYSALHPQNISGGQVCTEWLAQRGDPSKAPTDRSEDGKGDPPPPTNFPFLCAGTFVGRASTLRTLLHRLFVLFRATQEYHDQALIPLLLLRDQQLGIVDDAAEIFLGLHGHDEFWDLERPLCRGSYFSDQRSAAEVKAGSFKEGLGVPRMRDSGSSIPPAVLHFNGNGKRHLWRCAEEFREQGILGGEGEETAECTFFDHDRRAWYRYG
ncbi:unnamed protein product [Polarella glacialis]|uniref:Uncharacterized protein n=1 Tax=Polarella glacialis TaxID=89957 RepID=A0A813GLX5_POLGL|nr:unnamed protein product [Polarella glacialis]